MAAAWSLLLALLLLSCNAICSRGCHLPHAHSLANRGVLMLLRQLKSVSPFSCLQDRNDFSFPQEVLGGSQLQKAQAISVLHEVTQHTFQLFSTEGSAAAWDQSLLDKLCAALDQQLTDLQACLRQEEGLRGAPLPKEDSSLAHLAQLEAPAYRDSPVLHAELALEFKALDLETESMASENLPQGSTRRRLSQPSSSRIFPMAFVLSLLMALVLVSYGPGGSLGCDLSQNHVLVGRKNIRLLGQMRRLSPRFCLQDRKDFAFPQDLVEGGQLQEAQAISVLHEMLQQSFNLFHTESSSAAWNTTLLEQLRTGLHQQLDDLDACLGQVMGEEDSALGRTGPTLAVKRYFQGIHVYLQEKEYSDCAWETVRVEIMRSLSSSTSLQEMLRMMDGDLNSPLYRSH
ncbi:hypothetical protein AB1E18_006538 [Capra hircus]